MIGLLALGVVEVCCSLEAKDLSIWISLISAWLVNISQSILAVHHGRLINDLAPEACR